MKVDEIQKAVGHVFCHVDPGDIDLICKYAAKAKKGEILVDLGTAYGKSATAMALVNPEITVYTLDIEVPALKFKELPPNLILLRGDSRTYPWDKEIAMMNDDCGSHLYDETKLNIEHWVPHVKKGGFVVFHDYDLPEFGVKKVVDEFVENGLFEMVEKGGVSCAVRVL